MTATLPGDWDDLIIIAGGEYWGEIWGSHRHLAEALSRHRPVLYVDQPVSALTRFRRESTGRTGLRLEHDGLAVLVPGALPGLSRPGIRRTTAYLTRRAIRTALGSLGSPHVSALVITSLDDLFDSCAADVKVLYATDDFTAGADLMGQSGSYLRSWEERHAASADEVVVVSHHLARKWRALGHEPVVVPNGCDPDRFADVDAAPLPNDVHLPAPVAGMVGRISPRVDLSLVEAVADTGASLLIVGPRDDDFEPARVDRLLARPNVGWVGRKRFEDLPSYLRVIDVGLTPYADTEFNRASFPLKTLEYLSAGRASVISDLPAAHELGSELVDIADGPAAFAAAVSDALAQDRTEELQERRRQVARAHSWAVSAAQFQAAIEAAARRDEVDAR